jgi:hypothetical protein
MGTKTCLNCIHGRKVINEDVFVNENARPYRIICARSEDIDDLIKKDKWNEFQMPKVCGHYEPTMIEHCAYCKCSINVAEYLWDIWAGTNGRPVCSSDCRVKLEAAEIGNFFYDDRRRIY